jgi:predicted N-acetyltransferase YhbS
MATAEAREFRVCPAQLQDAAEIARLTTELGYPSERSDILPRLRELLARDDYLILVASDEGERLLGMITAERRHLLATGVQVEIMSLVVGEKARRRGVGKALVEAAESWTVRLGVSKVVVRSNVVRPESHPFYEGIGYRRSKTQRVYLKEILSP